MMCQYHNCECCDCGECEADDEHAVEQEEYTCVCSLCFCHNTVSCYGEVCSMCLSNAHQG